MTACLAARSWRNIRTIRCHSWYQSGLRHRPLLFNIFFSMMLLVAFEDCEIGVPIRFRTDGSIFNLRRLQAHAIVIWWFGICYLLTIWCIGSTQSGLSTATLWSVCKGNLVGSGSQSVGRKQRNCFSRPTNRMLDQFRSSHSSRWHSSEKCRHDLLSWKPTV